MKKRVLLLAILVLLFPSISVLALEQTDIHSNEALLVNMTTDEVLFSKNTNPEAVPIASFTKLMTYAVVIDEIEDINNTMITVPTGLVAEIRNQGASVAGLRDDYTYSAIDLLYGLMLPSGCDAAEVLARYLGNGDSTIFVQKMNEKAQELGMNDTIYIDAHGLGTATEDNMSTEQDQYKLIKYLINKPYFKEIVSSEYYDITATKGDTVYENVVRNTNYLVGEFSGGEYYYPYSIGGKTGTLSVAGKCLLTIAQKGNTIVVAITLGVPGQSSSSYTYHLQDNIKLLEYAFVEKTENITIDIGYEYRSMEIGKQIKIEPITSSETAIKWQSNNPKVATVDENGVVTGHSLGQAKITAITSTGNLDYTFVSVGFYNGVHTKYSTGPSIGNQVWGPIDWDVIINKGFDYAIIRAGYGTSTTDKTFVQNMNSALEKGMNVGIWYEGYATSTEEALLEAQNLINILEENFPNMQEQLTLPILYNIFYADTSDPNILLNVANTFADTLQEKGYKVLLELGKTKLSTMDLENLISNNVDLCIIYRSTPPDYDVIMNAKETNASIWNYKANAYLGKEGIGTNASLSLMYMDYLKLNTNHKEYIHTQEEEKNENESEQKEPINKKPNKPTNLVNTTSKPTYVKKEEIKNKPEIVSVSEERIKKGKDLEITIKNWETIDKVLLDQSLLNNNNYKIINNNVFIIDNRYLEKLTPGKHTISFIYDEEEISTVFYIEKEEINNVDETKEQPNDEKNNLLLYIMICIILIIISIIILIKLKRK